jgi:plasmid stabilization system protein ParE
MDGAAVNQSAGPERGPGRRPASTATHFEFEHRIFQLEKSYFTLAADTREAIFLVTLGDLTASIRLPALRREFNIEPESVDGQLLSIVEKGLRFVREIRHRDSIPRELLDGSASWSVSERHRLLARTRMTAHVLAAVEGIKSGPFDIVQLETLASSPEFRQKLRGAFGSFAEQMGIGADRKQEIVDRIEDLAREYAYIEALRERSLAIRQISIGVAQLAKQFKTDKNFLPEIVRVQTLVRRPVEAMMKRFVAIESRIATIETVLANFQQHIDLIRASRDDFHGQLNLWDDLVLRWSELDREKPDQAKLLIRETYRFTATHFPQTQDW